MGEALSRFPLPKELQVVHSCWQRIAIFIWGSGLKHGDLESAEIKVKITSNLLAKLQQKISQTEKQVGIHTQELFRTPNTNGQRRPTPHITVKISKMQSKEAIPQGVRGKDNLQKKSRNLKTASDPSSVAWESKEAWDNIFHTLKIINSQLRLMCPAKLSLRIDWGEEGYFKTNTN